MSKWRIKVERLDLENNVMYQSQHEVTDEMIVESRIGEKEMLSMTFLHIMHKLKSLIQKNNNEQQ